MNGLSRRELFALALAHGLAACGATPQREDEDPLAAMLTPNEVTWARQLSPAAWPTPPPDPTNRFADDTAAATLGQRLFFDAGFSGPLLETDNNPLVNEGSLGYPGDSGRVACASCHIAADDFVDTRTKGQQISLAAGWVMRRTPSLLDALQSPVLMWDGRANTGFAQVVGALESHLEMNSGRLFVAQRIFQEYRDAYEAIFGPLPPLDDTARFPELTNDTAGCVRADYTNEDEAPVCHGKPGDGAEYDGLSAADQVMVTEVVVNAGKAITAFQRLLSCGPSRFDAWVHGEAAALADEEVRGFKIFVGKAGCVACHDGPFFTDNAFHNVGLQPKMVNAVFIDLDDPGASKGQQELVDSDLNSLGPYSDGDDGRTPATLGDALLGAFKTPSLRCVAHRPSYMHTAQLTSLDKVVRFFDAGGDAYGFLGESELQRAPGERIALGLSDDERSDVVRFLEALEGAGPDPALRQRLP